MHADKVFLWVMFFCFGFVWFFYKQHIWRSLYFAELLFATLAKPPPSRLSHLNGTRLHTLLIYYVVCLILPGVLPAF